MESRRSLGVGWRDGLSRFDNPAFAFRTRSILFDVDFGAFSAGDHRGSVCWQPGREGSRLGRRISRDVILPFEIRVACKEMSPPSFSAPASEDAAMALLFAYRTSLARRL